MQNAHDIPPPQPNTTIFLSWHPEKGSVAFVGGGTRTLHQIPILHNLLGSFKFLLYEEQYRAKKKKTKKKVLVIWKAVNWGSVCWPKVIQKNTGLAREVEHTGTRVTVIQSRCSQKPHSSRGPNTCLKTGHLRVSSTLPSVHEPTHFLKKRLSTWQSAQTRKQQLVRLF